MPQDKRRPISYRTFVTCNDPKGVVECGAIRKTKIRSPQKKGQNSEVEGEKKQGKQNPSSAGVKEDKNEMGIGEITRELEAPVSFQLLGDSQGAGKLNDMINSCPNAKEQQKEISKSLLKGALDLQESLVKLRMLQEASSYTSGLTTKEKKIFDEGWLDSTVQRFGFFPDEKFHKEFQGSCLSGDGLRRKSLDEMRKVVRDSLLRQNVRINPIFEEHFGNRKLSSPDMPSSSSSQSSIIHSSNFAPSDSSISSATSQCKTGKRFNLIVKLMGLESLPSSPRKKREADRMANLAKPMMYDIDSARARKFQFATQEMGTKQRTSDKILETVNLKGLLRSNPVSSLTPDSPCSKVWSLENRWIDERHPIDDANPMDFPRLDLNQSIMPNVLGECATVMKPRFRSQTPQVIISNNAANFSERRKEAGRTDYEERGKSTKKLASSKAKSSVNVYHKPQMNQACVRDASEVVNVTPTIRKGEDKKVAKLSHELKSQDQVKLTSSKVKRKNDGMLISKNQNSSQRKTTSTAFLVHRTQETSVSSNVLVKTRQPVLTGRSKRRKDNKDGRVAAFKGQTDSNSENDYLLPTADSMIADNSHAEKPPQASEIHITDYDDQSSLSDTREAFAYLHDDKNISVCDVKLTRAHEDNNGHKCHSDDNRSYGSDITSVSNTELCSVGHLYEDNIPTPEVLIVGTHENGIAVHLDAVEDGAADNPKGFLLSLSDATASPTQVEDCLDSFPEPNYKTWRRCMTLKRKLKALLLSSPSFASRAEELFGLQVNISVAPHVNDKGKVEVPDVASNKLLLDCANEVMEFTSLKFSQACLPLPGMCTINNPRTILSLDQLLEEICNGVEQLSYLRPTDDNFSTDNLTLSVHQDLKFKSGTWEIGWMNVFSWDEVEEVTSVIDKLIVGKLILEVLVDFMH